MALATGMTLIETAIKSIVPTYGGQPFVEAPRHTPIEDLAPTSEQRIFQVRPLTVESVNELEGLVREVGLVISVKVRYRRDVGSDESDRDAAIMAAVDAIEIVQSLTRPDVPATWQNELQDVAWVADLGNSSLAADPRAFIREQTFRVTAFE